MLFAAWGAPGREEVNERHATAEVLAGQPVGSLVKTRQGKIRRRAIDKCRWQQMRIMSQTDRKCDHQHGEQPGRQEKPKLACHRSFLMGRFGPRCTTLLPMAALLQGVYDLTRHVVLVVLGEHTRR